MATSFVDTLIDKGMSAEIVGRVGRSMVSHYHRVNEVHTKIFNCRSCELHKECRQPVSGTGEMNPEIVVLSDYPEKTEDKFNQTGFSPYAIYLMSILGRIGFEWDQVFWTHAVKCRPAADKIRMMNIADCLPNLVGQLAVLQPNAIIALGSTAISALAGEAIRIENAIGGEFSFTLGDVDVPVYPIRHPRTIIYLEKPEFQERTQEVWRTLRSLRTLLNEND